MPVQKFMTMQPQQLLRRFTQEHRCKPQGGAAGEVRGSPKFESYFSGAISVSAYRDGSTAVQTMCS